MLVNLKFDKNEIDKMLRTAIIIVDTREKRNEHILEYFDKHKIKYKKGKINYGDYCLMIPKGEYFDKDIYLNNSIVIERKANLNELSNNFTKDRERLMREFARKKGKMVLVVENSSYEDIVEHKYDTMLTPKSYLASLHTSVSRYDLSVIFMDSSVTGEFIYKTLIYYAREKIKEE